MATHNDELSVQNRSFDAHCTKNFVRGGMWALSFGYSVYIVSSSGHVLQHSDLKCVFETVYTLDIYLESDIGVKL